MKYREHIVYRHVTNTANHLLADMNQHIKDGAISQKESIDILLNCASRFVVAVCQATDQSPHDICKRMARHATAVIDLDKKYPMGRASRKVDES